MDTAAATDTWSTSRLRRRRTPSVSMLDVMEINGDEDDDYVPPKPKGRKAQKTVIVRAPEVEKARRTSLGKPAIELHMECFDDALSTAQLRANHLAKEAHALAMKQIQAAHEGRLSFKHDGTPIIHAQPILIHTPTVPSPVATNQTVNRGGYGVNLRAIQQIQSYNTQRRNLLGQTVTPTMTPITRPQLPQNSIPVGRVVAQPRKLPLVTQPVSGTSGFGVKRSFQELQNQVNLSSYEADAKKKRKSLEDEGDWVPLDEFYYGKLEGNAMYMEEKGEFRFKCWYCNKMLYNNLKAMMHLQSHIDSEKQQNLDLSDLTQCKHCYKQFDTPFEMQTHIEKVHLSNSSILMCRICEKDHDSNHALSQHMRNTHNAREMPYRCQCCNFQSSMYGDVVDHFRKKHDSSQNLLCLYCLRAFKVKIVNNRWGSTQNYYHHLVKHQSKSRSKKCPSCKLAFISPGELKTHQKKDHVSNSKAARMAAPTGFGAQQQVLIQVKGNVAGSGVKSLNAPAVMKHLDLSRLRIPEYAGLHHCFECKGSMSNVDHFKNHKECSMCRYATTCSSAYANHMLSFHSGRSALTTYLRVTREHPLPARRYCACGFSSRFGNKIANHMVFCYKRTCYSERLDPNRLASPEEPEVDPRRRPGASILDALGLVKKQTAKRSADGTEIVETPPNHAEMEEFVGVTNLSMAQTLRDTADQMALDNEKADDPDFEDGDSDVADVASDDDNDADFRPGRFSKPPKLDRPRQSGSTMFVKMNFFKNKQKKETPVKSLSPSETDSSAVTAPPSDDSGEVSKSETSAVIAPSGGDSMDGTSATSAITAPSADNAGEVMKLSEDKNGSDENLDKDETANTEQSKEAESHNIGQTVVGEGEASEQSENKMSGEVESNESKITNDVRAEDKIDTAVSENGEENAVENSATQDSGSAESILERTSEADLVSENATTEAKSDEITRAAEDGMETEVAKQGDELAEEGTASQGEDNSEMDVENKESETKSSVATPNDEPIDLDPEDAEPMETEEEQRTENSVLDEELREETADGASKGSKSEDSSMKPDESSTKLDECTVKQDESSVKPDESSMKQDHENNTEEISPANEENVQNDLASEDQETLDEPKDPSEVEKSSDVTQKESEDVSESQNSDKLPEDDSSGKNKPEHSTEDDRISEGKGMEPSKIANPESIVHEQPVGIPEASGSGPEPSKLEESEAPKSLPEDETVPSVEEKDSSNNKEREPSEVRLASKEQETKNSSESPSKTSRWGKTEEDSPSKRYSDSGDYYRKGGDRESHSGHRSGSSSYDRSDRHHGDSHHRHDRGYDSGYHGSRYDRDRDDKYRDRGSDRRYDDRGYSSRDHNRHDNRGYSSRDYDRHGNRYDRDQGHRRDSHGNRQNRYDNQRRDYY